MLITFIPIPLPWKDGVYNKVSGLYWCSYESVCIHEIGHKLDDEGGWISHSEEFYLTVKSLSPNVEKGFLNRNMEEIYARIYEHAGGRPENMPEIFHQFYDFERGNELLEKVLR